MPKIGTVRNISLADMLDEPAQSQLKDNNPHVLITARAGTGKTFTLMAGVAWAFRKKQPYILKELEDKVLKGKKLKPSDEQEHIWSCLEESLLTTSTILFTAYGRKVVDEFKNNWNFIARGVARHGVKMDFRTTHSIGYKMIRDNLPKVKSVNDYRTNDVVMQYLINLGFQHRDRTIVHGACVTLINLYRLNLLPTDINDEEERKIVNSMTEELIEHYSVETGSPKEHDLILRTVPTLVEHMRDVDNIDAVDNIDMIWLPYVKGFEYARYGVLLGDEVQDWNACQRELCIKVSERMVLVGDDKQAIFGFAGADFRSMHNIKTRLVNSKRGLIESTISTTRRCAKSIVAEVNHIVPDLKAMDDAPHGVVRSSLFHVNRTSHNWFTQIPIQQTFIRELRPGDLVIARTYHPLIASYLSILNYGLRAQLLGRDIGASILALSKDLEAPTLPEFRMNLLDWRTKMMDAEHAKAHFSQSRADSINDKYQTLMSLLGWAVSSDPTYSAQVNDNVSMEYFMENITRLLSSGDSGNRVLLATVHSAKGLEAERVFILTPSYSPLRSTKAYAPWQQEEEKCIEYVAVTRARTEVVYVRSRVNQNMEMNIGGG